MKKLYFIIFSALLLLSIDIYGQNNIYLLGNLKGPKLKKRLKHFQKTIEKENNGESYTLLLLGDLRQKNNENEDTLIAFINRIQGEGANVIAVTGDRDWDKSKLYGMDTVTAMQNRFLSKIGNNILYLKRIALALI
ncbi:MAG: hypothetical protein JKX68_13915 [Flavobacteriales bacterium]|nr:hypothetical protein [Flavobacteriales bacterium]